MSKCQEKVLESDHPTEFGKIPKTEMNTTVIFKERRTNQILQNHNKNKMIWKQSMMSGVSLEASFTVITFKRGNFVRATIKLIFLSTQNWTYCKIVRLIGVTGFSTHANNKNFLCVRLWKGTCFGQRVLLSSFFFSSSLTQNRALKFDFCTKKRCFWVGGAR